MFKKIFNKNKKDDKEENIKEDSKGGAFLSFVLLNDSSIDFDKLSNDLKSDWDININNGLMYDNETEDYSRIFEVDDFMVAVSLMPAPIPNQEAEYHAKANHNWDKAEQVAKDHQAHVLVTVLNASSNLKEAAILFVKISSSVLKQETAIAIDTLGTLFSPEQYIEMAEYSIKEVGVTPLYNLVYFGMYQNAETGQLCAYTYGLENFSHREIEVINSDQSQEDLQNFMTNIAAYVLDHEAVLKDGETIGFTADQKLPLTKSKAVALDPSTTTIKIEY